MIRLAWDAFRPRRINTMITTNEIPERISAATQKLICLKNDSAGTANAVWGDGARVAEAGGSVARDFCELEEFDALGVEARGFVAGTGMTGAAAMFD